MAGLLILAPPQSREDRARDPEVCTGVLRVLDIIPVSHFQLFE